jgi:hypothetical protein
MKNGIILLILSFAWLGTSAEGRILTMTPIQSASTTSDPQANSMALGGDNPSASEEAVVAEAYMKFDLTGLTTTHHEVNMVSLEWPMEGVRPDTVSTYALYAVPSSNTLPDAGVPSTTEDDLVAVWNFSPSELSQNGGIILFDLTEVIRDCLTSGSGNIALVVKTTDLSAEQMGAQFLNAKLVVR